MKTYCDDCARFSTDAKDPQCRVNHPIRFKTPQSMGTIHAHDWGWHPIGTTCPDFVPQQAAEPAPEAKP